MSLSVFKPRIPPSEGTSTSQKLKLLKPDYADGYTYFKRDGINHIRRSMRLNWDLLHPDDAKDILNFMRGMGGDTPFFYTPSDEAQPIAWTCAEWSDNRIENGYRSVSLTLEECFDARSYDSNPPTYKSFASGVGYSQIVGSSIAASAASAAGLGLADGRERPGYLAASLGIGSGIGAGATLKTSNALSTGIGASNVVGADGTPQAARYWRIYIKEVQTVTFAGFGEVELYESPYGANVATGGTAFASSYYSSSMVPDYAFNNNPESYWQSNYSVYSTNPEWIGYDFGPGNAKLIKGIGLHSRPGLVNSSPKTFIVQWSHNGTTWFDAWTVVNSTGWINREFRSFYYPNAVTSYSGSPYGEHSFWRLVPTASVDGGYYAISEIQFRSRPNDSVSNTVNGEAKASSELDSNYVASYAFDSNNSTFWHTTGSGYQWIRYAYPSPVSVAEITIRSRPDGWASQAPQTWSLQFADNPAGPWRTTFQRISETGWAVGETRTYTDPAYNPIYSAQAVASGLGIGDLFIQPLTEGPAYGEAAGTSSGLANGTLIVDLIATSSGTSAAYDAYNDLTTGRFLEQSNTLRVLEDGTSLRVQE